MKKWSIAVLAMAILAAGAVSVSAAVDQTQPASASFAASTEKAALQGCDGIPDLDGTGKQHPGAGAGVAVSAGTAGTDITPNDDGIPDQDGTGNQYGRENSVGNDGNAANCPNENCPVNPDCDGVPSYDGAGAQHHGGRGSGNGHCKGQ